LHIPGAQIAASRRLSQTSALCRHHHRDSSATCSVSTLPLNRYGRFRAPWPPPSCARSPRRSAQSNELEGCRCTSETGLGAFTAGGWSNLSAAKASRFDLDEASRLLQHSRGPSVWLTRAQHRGLPGQQSTPDRRDRSASPEPCSGSRCGEANRSFIPRESRAGFLLLASPRTRRCCFFSPGAARDRTGSAGNPCKSGLAEPPGHLLDCREPRTETAESVHSRCANRSCKVSR